MSNKSLQFTVSEIRGRSYVVPISRVQEILESHGEDIPSMEDEYDLSSAMIEYLDEISQYEIPNDYITWELAESDFCEETI